MSTSRRRADAVSRRRLQQTHTHGAVFSVFKHLLVLARKRIFGAFRAHATRILLNLATNQEPLIKNLLRRLCVGV